MGKDLITSTTLIAYSVVIQLKIKYLVKLRDSSRVLLMALMFASSLMVKQVQARPTPFKAMKNSLASLLAPLQSCSL